MKDTLLGKIVYIRPPHGQIVRRKTGQCGNGSIAGCIVCIDHIRLYFIYDFVNFSCLKQIFELLRVTSAHACTAVDIMNCAALYFTFCKRDHIDLVPTIPEPVAPFLGMIIICGRNKTYFHGFDSSDFTESEPAHLQFSHTHGHRHTDYLLCSLPHTLPCRKADG